MSGGMFPRQGRAPENGVWWLGCALLCVVPFLSSWRTGPLSGMYLESGALLFALGVTAGTLAVFRARTPLPRAAWFWLVLALALAVQARVMDLPYFSQSDLAAAVCVGLAALSWTARVWVLRLGQDRAVRIVAWAVLAGALLQSAVCVLQFAGHTAWLPGLLAAPSPTNIYGQLAQRNHLGHYLMWGVLALCYLWHERRLGPVTAALLLLWLTGVMGLVGSRTIMAYIIAIGLALGFWRWRGGREANRLIAITALAVGLILLMQLVLSPVIEWLGGAVFQSGAERMGGGGFAGSGRRFEWEKAELLLRARPWFGYGWGGFAYHGFAETGAYPQGFRHYETQVLFTHSHNLIWEWLVSFGAVGTGLLVAGFLYAVWPLLRRPFSPASMILSLLLLVSLCHSMVEYPLWYVYFLAVFALFMALIPAVSPVGNRPRRFYWLPLVLCLAMMAEVVRMGIEYQALLAANRQPADRVAAIEQLSELKGLYRRAYWLRYYTDMVLVHKANSERAPLPQWGAEAAGRAARYRPYSNTFVHALYLAQSGRGEEAAAWMSRMAHYYPGMMPFFLERARSHPQGAEMVAALQAACREYAAGGGQTPACAAPASDVESK